jgi:tetratricopeptide (TPR) repeat protein
MPDYADAHFYLGNALEEIGQIAEAETAFERAVAIDPETCTTLSGSSMRDACARTTRDSQR